MKFISKTPNFIDSDGLAFDLTLFSDTVNKLKEIYKDSEIIFHEQTKPTIGTNVLQFKESPNDRILSVINRGYIVGHIIGNASHIKRFLDDYSKSPLKIGSKVIFSNKQWEPVVIEWVSPDNSCGAGVTKDSTGKVFSKTDENLKIVI